MSDEKKSLADLYKQNTSEPKPQSSQFEGEEIIGATEGTVIETPQKEEARGIRNTGISGSSLDNIDEYMSDMDKEILEAKEFIEKAKAEEAARKEEEAKRKEEEPEDDTFNEEKYNKAIVVIDKAGMGLTNFTDEERAKMERVSKIEVHEIENINLEALNVRKTPASSIDKVLKQKKLAGSTSNVVAVASGYTAVMGKCSLFELANLYLDTENIVESQLAKWSFVYSKIVDSSIEFKDFDDFTKKTAVVDYNNFIYGILAASYPDEDEVQLTCPSSKCPGKKTTVGGVTKVIKDYPYRYNPHGLIRAERMSEALLKKFTNVIDNSYNKEDAKKVHEESEVNTIKRYKLPGSEYIIDMAIESVNDFIYNAAKVVDELDEMDEKYRQSLLTSTTIRALYIPDGEGGYYKFENKLDIAKAIYELDEPADVKALLKISGSIGQDLAIDYGFANVECPYCHHNTPYVPVMPDDVLFHHYRQETQVTQ